VESVRLHLFASEHLLIQAAGVEAAAHHQRLLIGLLSCVLPLLEDLLLLRADVHHLLLRGVATGKRAGPAGTLRATRVPATGHWVERRSKQCPSLKVVASCMALLQLGWAGHHVERASNWKSGQNVHQFMVAMAATSTGTSKSLGRARRPSSWLPISAQSVKKATLISAKQATGVAHCLESMAVLTTLL